MKGETPILKRIHVALSKIGVRVFRNNVGKLQTKSGEWVAYGLCPGSSDLIGWTVRIITPEMVGKTISVFTAVEVKTINRRSALTPEQEAFLETVKKSGGIAIVVHSVEEATENFRSNLG